MTKEQKQTFTLRISNANKSELMVVLCDIFLCYAKDTKEKLEQWKEICSSSEGVQVEAIDRLEMEMKDTLRHTKASLREMMACLPSQAENTTNQDGEVQKQVIDLVSHVISLYRYVERCVIQADVKRDATSMQEAIRIVEKLNEAYKEASKKDSGVAMMQNAEKIYAGMTYGRTSIQESSNVASNRGFWA